jgi:hypothetical protein
MLGRRPGRWWPVSAAVLAVFVAWPGTPPGYFFTSADCVEISQADVLVRPANPTFAKHSSFNQADSVPHPAFCAHGSDHGPRSGRATAPPGDGAATRPVAQHAKTPIAVRGPPSS